MSIAGELKRRNVVRVAIAYLAAAWLLTEVAGTLFPLFDVPEWTLRFMVILLALGFIPALVFSWVYELTPDGLKREKDIVREQSITRQTARRLDLMTMGLIIVALLFIAADRLWLDSRLQPNPETVDIRDVESSGFTSTESTPVPDSIAVLPFVNRSANPDDIFFVDGIHDDLLTYVSQIGSLKVISRTSMMEYRDTLKKIPEIAGELGVTHVLEGGVQRAGDQVRINVQLIDARTDDHVWSNIYDRKLTAANVFAIQSEIAGAVAEALRATLTPEAQDRLHAVPTRNLAALEAYFMGRRQLAKRNVPAMAEAIEHFNEAVELDPEFALAYVGLADAKRLHASYSQVQGENMEHVYGQARLAIERALELDPTLGEAYASTGALLSSKSVGGAERAFQRAIELNPNYAPAYQWYGEMLGGMDGRITEALELSEKALSLDPMSAIINNDYGEVLQQAGRYEEALAQFQKSIELEPEFAPGYSRLTALKAVIWGRLDEAMRYQQKMFDVNPDHWTSADVKAYFFLELDELDKAAAWRNRALELAPVGTVPDSQLELALYLGEYDTEVDAAKKRLANRPRDFLAITYLLEHALSHGRTAEARGLLEQNFPGLASDSNPEVTRHHLWAAVNYAGLLQHSGVAGKAERLLAHCLAIIDLTPGNVSAFDPYFGVQESRIRTLLGDREMAISALPTVGDYGWWRYWQHWLKRDWVLQSIHEDSRFQRVVSTIEAELAAQRIQVREWQDEGIILSLPAKK